MSTIIRSDRASRDVATTVLALTLALVPSIARADDMPTAGPTVASPPAEPDPLSPLRERFREGIDKYKAGAFAEAIVIWEAIYRELGSDKGYRLAFDLARAYEEIFDLNKAAEYYETYLDRVAARRNEGERLEPNVEKQANAARERSEKIATIKGRIQVKPTPRPVIVRIDNAAPRVAGFTVYVEPGQHTVTFGEGREADARRVTLKHGELLIVAPIEDVLTPEPPSARWESRVERPFHATVLWVGAGVALASLIVPVLTYANALSIKRDYDSPATAPTDKARLESDYESARSNAYASILVPALFTAAAGALATYYVFGAKITRIPVLPQPAITNTGASLGVRASF